MDSSGIDRPEVSQERLSVAVQAAGLTCWEFSYAQRRFTALEDCVSRIGAELTRVGAVLRQDSERIIGAAQPAS